MICKKGLRDGDSITFASVIVIIYNQSYSIMILVDRYKTDEIYRRLQ